MKLIGNLSKKSRRNSLEQILENWREEAVDLTLNNVESVKTNNVRILIIYKIAENLGFAPKIK
jgi:hypothetical protein